MSDESVEAGAWDAIDSESPVRTLDAASTRLRLAAGQEPADREAVVFAGPGINAFALPGVRSIAPSQRRLWMDSAPALPTAPQQQQDHMAPRLQM